MVKDMTEQTMNKETKLLSKLFSLTLNLQEEVAELKEDTLKLQKDLKEIECDKNECTKKIQEGFKKFNHLHSTLLDEQSQDIERLRACMEVFYSHIAILEQRSKKFTDRFKFGRFKFKTIDKEQAFYRDIKELKGTKKNFVLNDD